MGTKGKCPGQSSSAWTFAFRANAVWTLLGLFLVGISPSAAQFVPIVPGVDLPLANIGGVHSFPSNYTLWLQLGGRGLDTALIYDHGDHDVQWAVGDAVRRSVLPRSELFITTKVPCCPGKGVFVQGFDADGWCAAHGYYNGSGVGRSIADSVAHDLEQLQLPFVDLLLLHWPCGTIAQTVEAYRQLEPFVSAGKARAIGVSNMNATMLDAIVDDVHARADGIMPAVNQVGFSIGAHNDSVFGSDAATRASCVLHGVQYEAYSPLGGLSGVDVLRDPTVQRIAATHNASTATVALRWVVQQGVPFVTSSTDAAYDREDLAAALNGTVLSAMEMAMLTAI